MDQPTTMPQAGQQKPLPSFAKLLLEAKNRLTKRIGFFVMMALIPPVLQFIGELVVQYTDNLTLFVAIMVLSFITSIFAVIAFVLGYSNESLTDWMDAYRQSTKHFWSFLWSAILVGIVTLIGYILFIIPGIYFSIVFVFYPFFAVLEGAKGWEAAKKSKELIKGYGVSVFFNLVLFAIVVLTILLLLSIPVGLLQSPIAFSVYNLLVSLLLMPFSFAFLFTLYSSLKKIKAGKM